MEYSNRGQKTTQHKLMLHDSTVKPQSTVKLRTYSRHMRSRDDHFCSTQKNYFSVELGDPFQGPHSRTGAAPLVKPPVLPRLQEVLAPTVVGVLMKDPVTFQDSGREDVAIVEACTQIWAILHHLHGLAFKIRALKDLYLVVSFMLEEDQVLIIHVSWHISGNKNCVLKCNKK